MGLDNTQGEHPTIGVGRKSWCADTTNISAWISVYQGQTLPFCTKIFNFCHEAKFCISILFVFYFFLVISEYKSII